MLIESRETGRAHEADPPVDLAMLAFQYLTAVVAASAAILLAFVH